jgi:ribosome biogenesis protein Nip4
MKEFNDFLQKIGSSYHVEEKFLKLNNKRFLANKMIIDNIYNKSRLVYAGKLLGRTGGEFIPSSTFLQELAKYNDVNKIWVNEKVGWLFICGRDIFKENIIKNEGSLKEGCYSLVMHEEDCLGYGKIEENKDRTIFRNLFNIGDFIQREKDILKTPKRE